MVRSFYDQTVDDALELAKNVADRSPVRPTQGDIEDTLEQAARAVLELHELQNQGRRGDSQSSTNLEAIEAAAKLLRLRNFVIAQFDPHVMLEQQAQRLAAD